MNERELRERLGAFRAPGESAGEERLLVLARAALPAVGRRRSTARARVPRVPRRVVLAVALLALGTAGAAAAVELGSSSRGRFVELRLPASGTLLVSASSGSWAVQRDRLRLLGRAYRDGALSPRALNAAFAHGRSLMLVRVANGRRVATVPTDGPVSLPRWSLERGGDVRIAFRSGGDLYLVGGDGVGPGGSGGPRLIGRSTLAVAPAWRPHAARRTVAYLTRAGLRIAEADSGRRLGTLGAVWRGTPLALTWARGGFVLQLATTLERVRIAVSPAGVPRVLDRLPARPVAGVPSPDGRLRALARPGRDAIELLGDDGTAALLPDIRANLDVPRGAPLRLVVSDWKG